MNIKIFGHVCIDRNISENSTFTGRGSPAVFIKKMFNQLPDCNVEIIASYGNDSVRYLDGINIYPKSPNAEKTLIYENISFKGLRSQKAFNRMEALPVPIDKWIENGTKVADIIFFAPILPNYPAEYYAKVASLCKHGALKVLLPQGYFRDFDSSDNVIIRDFNEGKEILSFIDIVIASEQDHPDMIHLAQGWVKNNNLISLITRGEKGALALTKHGKINLPAREVKIGDIVDSVGSGDIFSAGFAYIYKQTRDIKEAGRFANELARQCLFYPPDKMKIDLTKLI